MNIGDKKSKVTERTPKPGVPAEPGAPLVLNTLDVLKKQLSDAKDAAAQKKTGQLLLSTGAPLLGGSMKPAHADALALKPGATLPPEQQGYFDFWLLRARAAVPAGDEAAGRQADQVLAKLGAADSPDKEVLNVMTTLRLWLAGHDNGPGIKVGHDHDDDHDHKRKEHDHMHSLREIFEDTSYGEYTRYAREKILWKLQAKLEDAGLYTKGVDGKAGPGTCEAISRWQTQHRLTATGKLNQETLVSLSLTGERNVVPKPAPPKTPEPLVDEAPPMVPSQPVYSTTPGYSPTPGYSTTPATSPPTITTTPAKPPVKPPRNQEKRTIWEGKMAHLRGEIERARASIAEQRAYMALHGDPNGSVSRNILNLQAQISAREADIAQLEK